MCRQGKKLNEMPRCANALTIGLWLRCLPMSSRFAPFRVSSKPRLLISMAGRLPSATYYLDLDSVLVNRGPGGSTHILLTIETALQIASRLGGPFAGTADAAL